MRRRGGESLNDQRSEFLTLVIDLRDSAQERFVARSKKIKEPTIDPFKVACLRLQDRVGLRDWEIDFIASNTTRPDGYEYSEAQHAARIQIDEDTFPVDGADGYTNAELVNAVAEIVPLLPYDDEVWFKALAANDAKELPARDVRKLIAIARSEDRL